MQTGTSDTVEMLGEEEVWEVESSRELVPLGWIHTHPTQVAYHRLRSRVCFYGTTTEYAAVFRQNSS
jgi:hypothetical protein